jgi:hypothetical protein
MGTITEIGNGSQQNSDTRRRSRRLSVNALVDIESRTRAMPSTNKRARRSTTVSSSSPSSLSSLSTTVSPKTLVKGHARKSAVTNTLHHVYSQESNEANHDTNDSSATHDNDVTIVNDTAVDINDGTTTPVAAQNRASSSTVTWSSLPATLPPSSSTSSKSRDTNPSPLLTTSDSNTPVIKRRLIPHFVTHWNNSQVTYTKLIHHCVETN